MPILPQKLQRIQRALVRHLVAKNSQPYEQILQYVRAHGDIWITSQGAYMAWWQEREQATCRVIVSEGMCRVQTSLKNAVIEKFPGQFLEESTIPCEQTNYSGEVWLTLDRAIEKKEILIEILKREGILNFRVANEGEFMLSHQEVDPLLEEIEERWRQQHGRWLEADVAAIRQVVIDKLTSRQLPLLRVWYHPRVNGSVTKAVFSPRFDVDRAITNLAHIRALENRYDVPSTLYIRAFCPFYSAEEITRIAAAPWCSEIALHGEFVTHARYYGDEFKAAIAEKTHLEKLTGRSVVGVGMHGGELSWNRSEHTDEVIQKAGLLYDTTPRPAHYYFPFKKILQGQLSQSYALSHALSDVNVPVGKDYDKVFYEQAVAKMDEIYHQHGVFVLMMHPEYFGFFSYLAQPKNWQPLVKFSAGYFRQAFQRG